MQILCGNNAILLSVGLFIYLLFGVSIQVEAISAESIEDSRAISVNRLLSGNIGQLPGSNLNQIATTHQKIPVKNIGQFAARDVWELSSINDLREVAPASNLIKADSLSEVEQENSNEYIQTYQQADNFVQRLQTFKLSGLNNDQSNKIIEEWLELKSKLHLLIAKQQELDEVVSYINKLKRVADSPVASPSDIKSYLQNSNCNKNTTLDYFWPKCSNN